MARLLHVAHLQVGGRVAQALARDCAAALRAAEARRAGVVAEAVEREAGAVLQLPAAARQRRAVGLPLLRACTRAPSATYLVDPASGMPGVSVGALVRLACPSCARAPAPSASAQQVRRPACLLQKQVHLCSAHAICSSCMLPGSAMRLVPLPLSASGSSAHMAFSWRN